MPETIYLTTPLTTEMLEPLKIGDSVMISGTIYTARDAAHKRLAALLEEGKEPPFDLAGQIIYYVRRPRERSSALPAPPPATEWIPTPRSCWKQASRG